MQLGMFLVGKRVMEVLVDLVEVTLHGDAGEGKALGPGAALCRDSVSYQSLCLRIQPQ